MDDLVKGLCSPKRSYCGPAFCTVGITTAAPGTGSPDLLSGRSSQTNPLDNGMQPPSPQFIQSVDGVYQLVRAEFWKVGVESLGKYCVLPLTASSNVYQMATLLRKKIGAKRI